VIGTGPFDSTPGDQKRIQRGLMGQRWWNGVIGIEVGLIEPEVDWGHSTARSRL